MGVVDIPSPFSRRSVCSNIEKMMEKRQFDEWQEKLNVEEDWFFFNNLNSNDNKTYIWKGT